MGKHSNKRRRAPEKIERLEPASRSRETPREHARRKKEGLGSRVERTRRKERRRRVIVGVAVSFLVFVLVGVAAAYFYMRDVDRRLTERQQAVDPEIQATLSESPEADEPFYVLLLGSDSRGEEHARADTIILVRLDPDRERISMLSIPRDTRVEIPGHGTDKINAANTLGGPSLMIETVRDLTDLPISHYVEVDFNGFKEIVDAIGGVEIDVPQRIYDPKAANYDSSAYVVEAGPQELDGKHALTFVRSRNFPDGDFTRMQNQQIFLKALARQTLTIGNVFKLDGIVDATVENITTDLSVREMMGIANTFRNMDLAGIESATVPAESRYSGGVSYVVIDETAFEEMLATFRETGHLEAAPEQEPEIVPGDVTVTVRNGAGIAEVATQVADQLGAEGFAVGEVGNMNQFVYDDTLIIYAEDDTPAQLVRRHLDIGEIAPSRGMYSFTTDVLVVVGKDWPDHAGGGTTP